MHTSLNSYDHYVSVTYLKKFSKTHKHVFVYRKKEKLEREMNIESICGARGGDICHGLGNIYALREILSDLEPIWNTFICHCQHLYAIANIYMPLPTLMHSSEPLYYEFALINQWINALNLPLFLT